MVDFNIRLKKLRDANGLTQTQVAKRLGVSKSIISAYESGTRLPSYKILIKIAYFFKVTTDYLLGIDSQESLDLSGLTEDEKLSIYTLVQSMKRLK